MIRPSRKLLSIVMGKDVFPLSYEQNNDVLRYCRLGSAQRKRNINVYKLMHMMKLWADKKGYIILSRVDGFCTCNQVDYISDTEFEAVLLCCEHILIGE